MSEYLAAAQALVELAPEHTYFVGVDSDGCVFDTMEIKHKECFCPNTIKYWGLQAVSKYAREAVEFVNLYSQWRGVNRWPALVRVFDLLRERAEVQARQAAVPTAARLREFVAAEAFAKSDGGLRAYMAQYPDPELDTALAWTTAVNDAIAGMVHGVPPYPHARESLAFLAEQADMMVVSATPVRALTQEWQEHDLARYARLIAGQELGSKARHLELAAKDKYAPERILMIGDAPGDMQAARANNALFYPINPGHEEESWQRFREDAVHKFLAGTYQGAYEAHLVAEFEQLLPKAPPWKV